MFPGSSCRQIHSLATSLEPHQHCAGCLFVFRNALILWGTYSTRCWKLSSKILVHIDIIASHGCCRFIGSTSTMQICSTTSQSCSFRFLICWWWAKKNFWVYSSFVKLHKFSCWEQPLEDGYDVENKACISSVSNKTVDCSI